MSRYFRCGRCPPSAATETAANEEHPQEPRIGTAISHGKQLQRNCENEFPTGNRPKQNCENEFPVGNSPKQNCEKEFPAGNSSMQNCEKEFPMGNGHYKNWNGNFPREIAITKNV